MKVNLRDEKHKFKKGVVLNGNPKSKSLHELRIFQTENILHSKNLFNIVLLLVCLLDA
jgi:hypothetical protein